MLSLPTETEPSAPSDKPVADPLEGRTTDDAQRVAEGMFDPDARVKELATVAIVRFQRGEVAEAVALAERVAEGCIAEFPHGRALSVLTELLRGALAAASDPSVLVGLGAFVERAFFRCALERIEGDPATDQKRAWERERLQRAFDALLELHVLCDPARAMELHRFAARRDMPLVSEADGDAMRWARRPPSRKAMLPRAAHGEGAVLARIDARGKLAAASDYLSVRVADTTAADPRLEHCIEAIRMLAVRRFESGDFRGGIAILSDLVEKRDVVWWLANPMEGHMPALIEADLGLALRALRFMQGTALEDAKSLVVDRVVQRVAAGDHGLLAQSAEALGEPFFHRVVARLSEMRAFDRAIEAAGFLEGAARHECMADIAVRRGDLGLAAAELRRWKGLDRSRGGARGNRRTVDEAIAAAVRDSAGCDDCSGIHELVELAETCNGVDRHHLDAARRRILDRSVVALNATILAGSAPDAMQRWRGARENRRKIHRDRGADFAELDKAEDRLARWLLAAGNLDDGLQVARSAWKTEFLRDHLLGLAKESMDRGSAPNAARFLEAAESIARGMNDFATLTVIGNQYLRLGESGRGKQVQHDARALHEEAESRRQQEEDDWFYDD